MVVLNSTLYMELHFQDQKMGLPVMKKKMALLFKREPIFKITPREPYALFFSQCERGYQYFQTLLIGQIIDCNGS